MRRRSQCHSPYNADYRQCRQNAFLARRGCLVKGRSLKVIDPTFRLNGWLTVETINANASGNFLVPAAQIPEGWRRLSRYLRYRRATRPDRAATADAYGGADWSAGYFGEFRRAVRVDWKPYVEWWQRPYRGAYVTLDERGLRPTPGEETTGSEVIRILCFGGSTMMGMGARDDHTIPAVLARRLTEGGHQVSVTNYGQLGHNSTQEVITLQQLLKAGKRMDIALFYDGINEMACAEQTGCADGLFNEARRGIDRGGPAHPAAAAPIDWPSLARPAPSGTD